VPYAFGKVTEARSNGPDLSIRAILKTLRKISGGRRFFAGSNPAFAILFLSLFNGKKYLYTNAIIK